MLYQTKNPHGGDLYARKVKLDFSANTNPLGTPESVRRAVVESAEKLNQYPDPYCRELVAALSEFEQVPQEYLLCGCGAAELIFSFCTAVKPKKTLELAPTFSEYSAALEAIGCRVERYPLRRENDFALTGEFLDALQSSGCEVLFLCNPNNPTGQVIGPELLQKIALLCHERGIRLFLDECFLDLSDQGRQLSLKEKLKEQPGLFILKAFTKSYGMAGLRLGYCLSADRELLTAMGRSVQPWNVSLPAQCAGVAALKEVGFLNQTRAVIQTQRGWLKEQMESLGLYVCPAQANYLLLYHEKPLYELLLRQGILVRDCSNYHGLCPGWIRVAVRCAEENKVLVEAIRAALQEER
ncbi:MAG: pyridoxal phosphate-dependent aminotransferase [Oscillospiraceae bacterium]